MKRSIFIFVFALLLVFVNACTQPKNTQNDQQENSEESLSYLTVDDVFAQGDSLANKTIHVEGIIEHVCKHTWKRFKIIGENENQFIKIELGDKFPKVDTTIIGKKVKVTGKLIPTRMDAQMVKNWEERARINHKGEEDTEHFKEEIKFIQNIHNQIISGEIPYYTNYTIEAETYELE